MSIPFHCRERRRCEPGSNSVIVTNALTSVEGHVLRLGGVLRTRKIFVGCPAIRPFWDQSPGIRNPRLETVGNRLYPLNGQISLCCSAAEAQIQDRSRDKTGPNTAPGFTRVYNNIPSPSMGEGQGEGDPAISQHAREQQWFRNRLHVRVSRRPTASGLNCAQIDKQ